MGKGPDAAGSLFRESKWKSKFGYCMLRPKAKWHMRMALKGQMRQEGLNMATGTTSSPAIAMLLADIWAFHKSASFAGYIANTYGKCVDRLPSFECVYIAESESGDLDNGTIGGVIKKWWRVDGSGLTENWRPRLPSTDEPGLFDRRPVLKFFTDGERVIVGERLGPNLNCRKLGRLINTATLAWLRYARLLWTTKS
jgi:hypothetical protein